MMPSPDSAWRRALARAALPLLMLGTASAHAPTPTATAAAATTPGAAATPAAAPGSAAAPADPLALSHGLFTGVHVLRPHEPARQFVMLLTEDATPSARDRQLLRTLVDAGAMVATVPFAPFYQRLERQDGKCTYGPGAFENLARDLQAFEHLPGYLTPLLAGADGQAAYVYSVLAQAPAGSFAGGLSLGFCPRLPMKTPPCAINGLRWQDGGAAGGVDLLPPAGALASSWVAVQSAVQPGLQSGAQSAGPSGAQSGALNAAPAACGAAAARGFVQAVPRAEWSPASSDADSLAAFERGYRKLAVPQVPLGAPPTQLSDLPIVEVPATSSGSTTRFAVLLSGDGGWAGIDKALGQALAAQGVPVAGFDSLRYFWSARTPQELATDLDRVIRYYAARWGRSEVILVGYSQGADVLPFALNRLPPATRAYVRLTALLGPGQKASFEFHLSNWMGPSGDMPIAPEALKLNAASTLCIYGEAERDSLCPQLAPEHARALPLTGGHHFGGDYAGLAARILDAAPR